MTFPVTTTLNKVNDLITVNYLGQDGYGPATPMLWLRPNENKITFNFIPGQWEHGIVNTVFRRLNILLQVQKKYDRAGYYLGAVRNFFDYAETIEPLPGVYPYDLSHLRDVEIEPVYEVDFHLNKAYTVWLDSHPQPYYQPRTIYVRQLSSSGLRFTTQPNNPIGNSSTSYARMRSLLIQPFDFVN